jgi:hypothetical protein
MAHKSSVSRHNNTSSETLPPCFLIDYYYILRLEILMVVTMMPCDTVNVYQYFFGQTCCLRLQGRRQAFKGPYSLHYSPYSYWFTQSPSQSSLSISVQILSCSGYSSTLKIEAAAFSEILVNSLPDYTTASHPRKQ